MDARVLEYFRVCAIQAADLFVLQRKYLFSKANVGQWRNHRAKLIALPICAHLLGNQGFPVEGMAVVDAPPEAFGVAKLLLEHRPIAAPQISMSLVRCTTRRKPGHDPGWLPPVDEHFLRYAAPDDTPAPGTTRSAAPPIDCVPTSQRTGHGVRGWGVGAGAPHVPPAPPWVSEARKSKGSSTQATLAPYTWLEMREARVPPEPAPTVTRSYSNPFSAIFARARPPPRAQGLAGPARRIHLLRAAGGLVGGRRAARCGGGARALPV